ncbi:MAG: DUF362 domain-containing protein [Oligoflexia bacterium]|nr:DUF362 domain-containing protein [Oligoflexia bacterium]
MPSSDAHAKGVLTRRALIGGAAALATAAVGANVYQELRQPDQRVLQMRCPSYDDDLMIRIIHGIMAFPAVRARARGAHIVLKPNLVELRPDRPINTDPRFIAAVAAAFLELGAGRVTVAEGAGHARDSEYLLEQSGLEDQLRPLGVPFVDLNVDDAVDVRPPHNLTGLGSLPVARTVMAADLLVSLPKLKTHHHVGVTLSMKNLFGTVPGHVVGWPKNPLHWAGIDNSVDDLWSGIQPAFAIVDGIIGMEGDGPIMGTAVPMGLLLFGDHLPAVDAVATRLMGLRPERVHYLHQAIGLGGTIAARKILIMGDQVDPRPFKVVDRFAHLRA